MTSDRRPSPDVLHERVSRRLARVDPNVVVLAGALVVATLIGGQDWFFDPLGSIDAFKYVGLFLNYETHTAFAPTDYKVSRLSWIFPGLASYRLLGPVAGHYALQLVFLAAAAIFLYLVVRRLFTPAIGLLTAAIFLTCPWFHGVAASASGGWNYHNTASLAYYFAGFHFLLTGNATARAGPRLLAGACLALCVSTTVFMAPFAALLLPVTWVIHRPPRRSLMIVAAGAALAVLGLACVNVLLGGRFLFIVHELTYTLGMSRENIWFQPIRTYASTAFWLVYPALTLAAIGVGWACTRCWRGAATAQERRTVLVLQAQFAVMFVHLFVLSTVAQQSVLQFAFMVFPLAGPMMPAMAASFFLAWRRTIPSNGVFASVVVAALLVGSLWGISGAQKAQLTTWVAATASLPARTPILVPLAGGMALVALLPLLGWLRVPLAGTACVFAFVNALAFPYVTPLSRDRSCNVNRDAFVATVEANRFLTAVDPRAERNRFIYAMDEFLPLESCPDVWLSQLFNGIYSTRFSPRVYDWADLPQLAAELRGPGGMVLLTSTATHEPFVGRFLQFAAGSGASYRVVASRTITQGPFTFVVTVLEHPQPARGSSRVPDEGGGMQVAFLPAGGKHGTAEGRRVAGAR